MADNLRIVDIPELDSPPLQEPKQPDQDTSSADVLDPGFLSDPQYGDFDTDPGAIIDATIPSEDKPLISPTRPAKDKAKSGPPTLDEWQDFFARILIRFGTEWYLSFVFRGIDEDMISDQDVKRLALTEEERKRIAIPFAEYANKSGFARKYGRQVIATAESFESIVTLGMWASRVNRIARKYRPKVAKPKSVKDETNVASGQSANGHGGFVPPEHIRIVNPHGG